MNKKVVTILVTGGAGFIGSNFIHYVLKSDETCRVVNLDLLTYAGNLENLSSIEENSRYKFYKGDIADSKLVGRIFKEENITHVVNFAAESHVDRSILGPEIFTKTNIVGSHVLIETFRRFYLEEQRKSQKEMLFLQVSTDEVYGSLGKSGYFKETTPLAPSSPYSASKAGSDMMVLAYNKTFGIPVVVTRCSNNYGPYQFPEKLIPLIIINALNNKELPVYGDGKNIRDWLTVKDHCQALYAVLFKGKAGEVYNIGGNNEMENIKVVKLILSILGRPESLIRHVTDRLGHDKRYAIDSGKIQTELGWKPSHTFEEGIEETVLWYKENKSWWERIVSGQYLQYYKMQYKNR